MCWKMKIWMRKSDFELESFFPHFNNSRLLLSFRSQPTDRSQTCQTIAYEEHCGQKKEKKSEKGKRLEQTTVTKICIWHNDNDNNRQSHIHGQIQ